MKDRNEKIRFAYGRLAGHEHVVAPDEEADPGDRDHRVDHEVVAEDAAPREARDDLA